MLDLIFGKALILDKEQNDVTPRLLTRAHAYPGKLSRRDAVVPMTGSANDFISTMQGV